MGKQKHRKSSSSSRNASKSALKNEPERRIYSHSPEFSASNSDNFKKRKRSHSSESDHLSDGPVTRHGESRRSRFLSRKKAKKYKRESPDGSNKIIRDSSKSSSSDSDRSQSRSESPDRRKARRSKSKSLGKKRRGKSSSVSPVSRKESRSIRKSRQRMIRSSTESPERRSNNEVPNRSRSSQRKRKHKSHKSKRRRNRSSRSRDSPESGPLSKRSNSNDSTSSDGSDHSLDRLTSKLPSAHKERCIYRDNPSEESLENSVDDRLGKERSDHNRHKQKSGNASATTSTVFSVKEEKDYQNTSKSSGSRSLDVSREHKNKEFVYGNDKKVIQTLKGNFLKEESVKWDIDVKKEKESHEDTTDSEEEIMFQWENHKWELNQLFFQDHDIIKKGSEEYNDFFSFLRKYQNIQKQKKIKSIISKQKSKKQSKTTGGGCSERYDLPLQFNNRYMVNFAIKGDSVDRLMRRLPPLDLDEKNNRLPKKKVEEFKNIILLYLNFVQKKNFEKLQKLRQSQSELPIAQYRQEIVKTVSENSIVLIAGDTGCGKSTQVPQYLMHAGYSNIACTQPRRIACISLCKRVAHETLNEFGSEVGYQIRFERKRTDHTKIVFLTEGLLLRQVNGDPSLGYYDVIILDEIHERHLHTDFLLGVVKCLLMQRTNVKIILMSATINLSLFSNYFLGKAPVIQVPGRLYPIKLQYFPVPMIERTTKSDKLNPAPFVRILHLIDNKYKEDERGDVLMFFSGFSEINTVSEAAKEYAQQSRKWVILPLHSNLSVSEQESVFDIPPEGVRKCIISTNIAETSITIDGVRFVVDSGKVKEMSYDAVCKMQKLKEFWVSQASAEQRKGRAGRTGPGVCFRLYSKEQYDSFDAYSTPEIQRVPLDSLILQMISMGIPDIRLFPFIEPPPLESLEVSVKVLKSQAAITAGEQLTTTGRLLSQLPVDVSIGKMLLMGSLFHQAEATLSLAASLSVQSVFTSRAQRDPDCTAALQPLVSHHGDPFTLLSAYSAWLEEKSSASRRLSSQRWCRARGLEEQRFYELTKLRHQFSQLLQQAKLHEAPEAGGRSCSTAAERAKRHGELQQLRKLQRALNVSTAGRKTKRLKMDTDGAAIASDGENEDTLDPKHLEFNIKNDEKQLKSLLENSDVQSFKDVIMLKIILSSGLYPNVAIADEHNTYKPNSEQLFHTPNKPFAALHPTSVLARQPEVLELSDADIVELPEFTTKNPAATKHQLLLYVSLLETNKPFLMNSFRVPSAQTLLLFGQSIDTNANLSTLVFDNFIELRFPDPVVAQNLVLQTVQLRSQWNKLLEMKLQLSHEDADVLEILSSASKLERMLSYGLLELYMSEPLHSQKRLLAADVKVLHKGPGPDDAILDSNPFSGDVCLANETKGGVDLTDYIVYNSLLEPNCDVTTLTETESVCVVCDEILHCRVLARLHHMVNCTEQSLSKRPQTLHEDTTRHPNAKEFFCKHCDKTLWLPLKEIFDHKKSHDS